MQGDGFCAPPQLWYLISLVTQGAIQRRMLRELSAQHAGSPQGHQPWLSPGFLFINPVSSSDRTLTFASELFLVTEVVKRTSDTGSCYTALALAFNSDPPPKCYNSKHAPPCLAHEEDSLGCVCVLCSLFLFYSFLFVVVIIIFCYLLVCSFYFILVFLFACLFS